MKHSLIYLFMLFLFVSFQDAEAQSIRSLMRKKIIEDNLEAQAKRDSARAVEKGEEPDQSPNTTMTHVYMDAMGLSGNVDYESKYDFSAYIQMEVSEYKKNEKLKDKTVYDSYINEDVVDYAMVFRDKNATTSIIFDSKNSAMLILTDSDGEKTGFAMGIDPEQIAAKAEEYAEESDTDSFKPHKTGRTKNILGYSCDEYLVEDEDAEARMWVSEKLGKQVRKEMLNNQQTFGAVFYHAAYLNGMVMEYDFLDKDDGERTVMQVTDIDLNHSHSISTRSYAVMTMKAPPAEEE
jgi:hypothetical protein